MFIYSFNIRQMFIGHFLCAGHCFWWQDFMFTNISGFAFLFLKNARLGIKWAFSRFLYMVKTICMIFKSFICLTDWLSVVSLSLCLIFKTNRSFPKLEQETLNSTVLQNLILILKDFKLAQALYFFESGLQHSHLESIIDIFKFLTSYG